jgi:hypothetical protein
LVLVVFGIGSPIRQRAGLLQDLDEMGRANSNQLLGSISHEREFRSPEHSPRNLHPRIQNIRVIVDCPATEGQPVMTDRVKTSGLNDPPMMHHRELVPVKIGVHDVGEPITVQPRAIGSYLFDNGESDFLEGGVVHVQLNEVARGFM